MYKNTVKLFLRFATAGGFLSAVADRFGIWNYNLAWGNWESFVDFTRLINPWFPESMIQGVAITATSLEIIFAICLIIGFKTELIAKLSGILLLIFALSMTFSTGVKTAFDASVFAAAGAAFAVSVIKKKFLEVDMILAKKNRRRFY